MIQVQVGKNFIDDVLIDKGFGVDIIIENLWIQLSLSKPNPTPYNLCMVDQTIAKPFGLIRDPKKCSWNSLYGYIYHYQQ
jgi:hypothetical protein